MDIVEYSLDDSKAVAAFFREIFQELGFTERESDFMDHPELLFQLPNDGALLIVKEGNQVIGTAGFIKLDETEGVIHRFYLKQSKRGTGLAQNLMDELFKKANSLKLQKLILDVSKKNLRAIRFYEKCGFSPTTVTPRDDWPESYDSGNYMYFYKGVK